jgi:hypothetical protein
MKIEISNTASRKHPETMIKTGKPSVGDWVEVRSKEEILRTLDNDGKLDGMPFMPEMFSFCGKRFQVYKRAHKTCDTVFPIRGRRVDRAVHLETRCDGQAHGGCQAGCLVFWKEAWLKPIGPQNAAREFKEYPEDVNAIPGSGCTEPDVWSHTTESQGPGDVPVYSCQATQLPYATTNLEWWDMRQYVEDYTSGNVSLWRIISGAVYSMYYNLSQAGLGLGRAMVLLYDKSHPIWRGSLFPRKVGTIPSGQTTPTAELNLQAGELVRVKPHIDILRTLNTEGKNRGMLWDAEMVPYCGGRYRILRRVTKIINEQTGKMQEMKTPSIVLDSVICQSRYSGCRMFCPRSIHSWWREIWLERVGPTEWPTAELRQEPEL